MNKTEIRQTEYLGRLLKARERRKKRSRNREKRIGGGENDAESTSSLGVSAIVWIRFVLRKRVFYSVIEVDSSPACIFDGNPREEPVSKYTSSVSFQLKLLVCKSCCAIPMQIAKLSVHSSLTLLPPSYSRCSYFHRFPFFLLSLSLSVFLSTSQRFFFIFPMDFSSLSFVISLSCWLRKKENDNIIAKGR